MGEPEFELDVTEEDDFNSPECIEAVHSISTGFKPHWSGKQLHDYYQDRVLTNEQVRAIVRAEDTKAKALDPEFIKEFTRKGEVERKLPDNLWDIVEELCPVKIPTEQILGRLKSLLEGTESWFERFKSMVGYKSSRKEIKCHFKGNYILCIDDRLTDIYETDVRNLWKKIAEFTNKREATEQVAQLLHKRLTTSV